MAKSTGKSLTEIRLGLSEKRPLQILHVDDEAAFLKTAKECLEMQGPYRVETAQSVEQAKDKMKKKIYDAIVCDYKMPGENGLQFLKELREDGNDIPFIMFTGKGREEVAIKALNWGADRYLNKHGGPEAVYSELAHSICQALEAKEGQKALRAQYEAFPVPTYTWRKIRKDFVLVDYNTASVEITHGNVANYVGEKASEMYRDRPKILEELSRCFTEKTVIKREMPYEFMSTGEIKYLNVTYAFVPPDLVLVYTEDITERKRVEAELLKSKERLSTFLSSSPDIAFLKDEDFRHLLVNDAYLDFLGMEREEVLGKTDFELLPEKLAEQCRESDRKVLREGGLVTVLEEGEDRVFETRKFPVQLGDGSVGIGGLIRDVTESRRAEEELRESERRFRDIADNALEWIWEVDTEGKYTYASPVVEKILGYNPEEVLEKHFYDLFHPRDREDLKKVAFKVFAKKQPFHEFINRNLHKNGKAVWLSTSGVPIFDEKGNLLGYRGADTDITENKKAEKALRESKLKFQGLFIDNPEAAVFVGPDFKILDANSRFIELFGHSLDELKGKALLDVIVPEEKLREAKRLDEEAKKGRVYSFDTVRKRKDGSIVQVSISAAPITVDDQLLGYVGLYKDISVLKRTQEELEEAKTHFQKLFDLMVDPVAVVDGKGKILNVSQRALEITGFKKEELVGKNFLRTKIATAKSKAIMMKNLAKRMIGMHMDPYEVEILTKDGRKLPYELNAAKIDYRGQPADMVVFRDITERKKMEEKLQVVGRLTRHDVRNKLSTVTGNTYLVKQRLKDDDKALNYLVEIESAVEQAVRIFDFARNYEKLGIEELDYMDVGKTFEEAVQQFSDLDAGVTKYCQGLTVLADSLLRQLFYNLIHNSLRHGEKVSQIRVYYEEEQDRLNLVYEDDGVGIPQAEKEKIFEEGYGKGTGYGLYLVRKICEVYGWSIKETGKRGKGAQFTITLPKSGEQGKTSYELR